MIKLKILLLITILGITGCKVAKKSSNSSYEEVKVTTMEYLTTTKKDIKISNNLNIATESVTVKTEYYKSDPATPGKIGDIKSVETTTTKTKESSEELTGIKDSSEIKENTEQQETSQAAVAKTSTPVSDPKRWMWLFGIVAIGAGIFMYVKGTSAIELLSILKKLVTLAKEKLKKKPTK